MLTYYYEKGLKKILIAPAGHKRILKIPNKASILADHRIVEKMVNSLGDLLRLQGWSLSLLQTAIPVI